ncbi:class I SAM-dependent methyltransferase [Microterricola viridarii]|uniref:Methyltransferase domain-containing protein n=1 Tax=Microterricola viridarii TaxID=412690 RepID=A0A1H1U899_9MICO|nr:class I SAM-dependent methyltransferase [Microterricola viridarii]SDS68597.1 Methyltransferase domain-containing protein [Microterricola viridarii]
MQTGRLQQHADSFRHGADGYDAHRPGYPEDCVDWLRGGASTPLDVLDLGAGTGKLSAQLRERGDRVTAVDPSADMLRVAAERMPGLSSLVGTAERIPLPEASVDLVTVAQAWHWVDEQQATREVLRVLRPGGRLGLIWNSRDDTVPWVAALSAAMHQGAHAAEFTPALGAGMTVLARQVTRWNQRTTRAGILGLATTRSYYLVASPAEQNAMLSRVEGVLDAHPETRAETILLPYVTECWLAAAWPDASA